MSVYVSRGAVDQICAELRGAQIQLNYHAVDLAGRCVRCATSGPCRYRLDAERRFAAYHRLPERLPGATRPQMVGARKIDVSPPADANASS